MTEKPFRIQKNIFTGKYSYFYPTGLYPSISAEDLLEVLILHLNNEYQCKNELYKENEELKSEIQAQKQIIAKQEMKLAEYNNQK